MDCQVPELIVLGWREAYVETWKSVTNRKAGFKGTSERSVGGGGAQPHIVNKCSSMKKEANLILEDMLYSYTEATP